MIAVIAISTWENAKTAFSSQFVPPLGGGMEVIMFNRKKQKLIAAIICAVVVISMIATMIFPYLNMAG